MRCDPTLFLRLVACVALAAAFAGRADARAKTTWVVPDRFSTIQAAVDAAQPGDDVFVRRGTYGESVLLRNDRNAARIVLRGEAGTFIDGGDRPALRIRGTGALVVLTLEVTSTSDGVSIDGPGSVVDGEGVGVPSVEMSRVTVRRAGRDGIRVGASFIEMNRCRVLASGADGIHAEGTADVDIEDCTIDGAGADGIDVTTDGAIAGVRDCKVMNCGGTGIRLRSGSFGVFRCVVTRTGRKGIDAHVFGHAGHLDGNRLRNIGGTAIRIEAEPQLGAVVVRNVVQRARAGISVFASLSAIFVEDNDVGGVPGKPISLVGK